MTAYFLLRIHGPGNDKRSSNQNLFNWLHNWPQTEESLQRFLYARIYFRHFSRTNYLSNSKTLSKFICQFHGNYRRLSRKSNTSCPINRPIIRSKQLKIKIRTWKTRKGKSAHIIRKLQSSFLHLTVSQIYPLWVTLNNYKIAKWRVG